MTQVHAIGAELALAAIADLLAAAAASAFLLRLGLVRQIRLFQGIDRAIAAFERGSWRSAASPSRTDSAVLDGDADAVDGTDGGA